MQQGFSGPTKTADFFYRFLLIVGFFAAIIHFSLFFIPESSWLSATVTKVIPCLFMSIWVFSKSGDNLMIRLVGFALLFNTTGDFLLELPGDFYFILGIAANLIGHIFYIISFTLECPQLKMKRYILPLFYFVAMIVFLLPVTKGVMRLAVLIYALVIVTMAWRALAAIGCQKDMKQAERFRFLGAFLFIVCDTFIAINVFIVYSLVFQLIIMASYWSGQLLIARATLKIHEKTG